MVPNMHPFPCLTLKDSKCQVQSKGRHASSMFAMHSPQRKIGSPSSNYLSCFQMQICVIKSTKQLKMQIERSCCSLSICWEEKKWNISIKASPHVFSTEGRANRFVCFCLKNMVWKSSQGTWAFLAAWELTSAFSFWKSSILCWFTWSPKFVVCKGRLEKRKISEPKWRVHSCGCIYSAWKRRLELY